MMSKEKVTVKRLAFAVSLLLIVGCYICLNSEVVFAGTIAQGECGDNVSWSLSEDYTLTVSGTGRMDDYIIDNWRIIDPPWWSYRDKIKMLIVEDGVTSIGARAFKDCFKLRSISLPDGLKKIDNGAFRACRSLTAITLPEGLTRLGEEAFESCSRLKTIYLPDSLVFLGSGAFSECKSLTSVRLSKNMTSISKWAFYECKSMAQITIPNGVIIIGKEAFCDCYSLKSVVIPKSVKEIRAGAFSGCMKLKRITIPPTVSKIGYEALGYKTTVAYGNSYAYNYSIPGFAIQGKKDSMAYTYAVKNEFSFIDIDTGTLEYSDWDGKYSKKVPSPKGVKIKAGNKKLTISWSKAGEKNLKRFSNVEIQLSVNRAFDKDKSSTKRIIVGNSKNRMTVKRLSRKTVYYVRVRNVKGSGRNKLVSGWSKTKKIRVK